MVGLSLMILWEQIPVYSDFFISVRFGQTSLLLPLSSIHSVRLRPIAILAVAIFYRWNTFWLFIVHWTLA